MKSYLFLMIVLAMLATALCGCPQPEFSVEGDFYDMNGVLLTQQRIAEGDSIVSPGGANVWLYGLCDDDTVAASASYYIYDRPTPILLNFPAARIKNQTGSQAEKTWENSDLWGYIIPLIGGLAIGSAITDHDGVQLLQIPMGPMIQRVEVAIATSRGNRAFTILQACDSTVKGTISIAVTASAQFVDVDHHYNSCPEALYFISEGQPTSQAVRVCPATDATCNDAWQAYTQGNLRFNLAPQLNGATEADLFLISFTQDNPNPQELDGIGWANLPNWEIWLNGQLLDTPLDGRIHITVPTEGEGEGQLEGEGAVEGEGQLEGEGEPIDTTPPVITLLGANPLIVIRGNPLVDPGATATDNVDGDLTSHIMVTDTVNINVVGAYFLTYSVSDAAGNEAMVARQVNVVEETPVCDNSGKATVAFSRNADHTVDVSINVYNICKSNLFLREVVNGNTKTTIWMSDDTDVASLGVIHFHLSTPDTTGYPWSEPETVAWSSQVNFLATKHHLDQDFRVTVIAFDTAGMMWYANHSAFNSTLDGVAWPGVDGTWQFPLL